jgi:hypothetical protein
MWKLVAVLLSLAAAAPAAITEDSVEADARARAVSPYLDAQAIALARVDVARIDLDAVMSKVAELGKIEAKLLALFKREMGRWSADFKNAGGKDLYFVFSLTDLPGAPFLVVPVDANADVEAIKGLLLGGKPGEREQRFPLPIAIEAVEKLDQALVAGSKTVLARVRSGRSENRPELAKAFAAAGDTTVQLLVLPTADSRRVIEELVPQLPKALGGGPSTILTHGMVWAALGLSGPPRIELRMVVQSKDAGAANRLRDLVVNGLKTATQEIRKDPYMQSQFKPLLPRLNEMVAVFTPAVVEDRLTLTVDSTHPTIGASLATMGSIVTASAERNQRVNNMKQIAIALHMYHDAYGKFPAVANFDKQVKPLLSWRVHLLPFLEQDSVYRQFHLDEPWDSEHNRKLIDRMPVVYRCPSLDRGLGGKTSYLAPVGPALMFTGGLEGIKIREVTDGTSNTIFFVDADDDHAVTWTRPDDLRNDPQHPEAGLRDYKGRGFNVAFVDGSIHILPVTIDKKTLQALFTRNGGEVVSGY